MNAFRLAQPRAAAAGGARKFLDFEGRFGGIRLIFLYTSFSAKKHPQAHNTPRQHNQPKSQNAHKVFP